MRYLTFEEVVSINKYLIQRFSPQEQTGVKSPELLDSAVNRPHQSAFGEDAYKTVFEKAAALFESVAQNHAFQNANKRTAFMALTQFLSYNGYDFGMKTQKEQADFTVDVVNKRYSFAQLVTIIEAYSSRF